MWTVLSSYGELTKLLKHIRSSDSFGAREGRTFLSQSPNEKSASTNRCVMLCLCIAWLLGGINGLRCLFCLLILQIALDVRESAEFIYLSFRLKCPWCDHSYFDDTPLLELWLWLG